MIELPVIPVANVPCNGCYECCRNQVVTVTAEFGDDLTLFRDHGDRDWKWPQELYVLRKKPNGDCVFLDRKTGCTIWKNRPAMCKLYDCVGQLMANKMFGRDKNLLPSPIRKAARKLMAQGYRPDTLPQRVKAMQSGLTIEQRDAGLKARSQ